VIDNIQKHNNFIRIEVSQIMSSDSPFFNETNKNRSRALEIIKPNGGMDLSDHKGTMKFCGSLK
jgi:hypothetical protein